MSKKGGRAKTKAATKETALEPLVQLGPDEHDSKPVQKKRKPPKAIIAGILFVFFLVLALDLYALFMAGRVLPGVALGATDFSFATKDQATAKLADAVKAKGASSVAVTVDDQKTMLNPADIDWQIDQPKTVEKMLDTGHRGPVWQTVLALLKSLFTHQQVSAVATFDEQKLTNQLSQFAAKVDQPEQNPTLDLSDDTVKFVPGKDGKRVSQADLKNLVLTRLGRLDRSGVVLARQTTHPETINDSGQAAISAAEKMVAAPLDLHFPANTVTVKTATLRQWIKGQVNKHELQAVVDSDKVAATTDDLATQNDQEPTNARLKIDNGQVSVITDGKSGQVTDRTASVDLITKTLEDRSNQPTVQAISKASLNLPAKMVNSDVLASTIQTLGVHELIGKATTSFAGSPQNRIHNISTGVSFLTGIVVKPGEEFSTIKALGNIDGSQGYLPELVIKENSTIPEFGGGLCQVSTTLFRAVMNAGLPITERVNHSYRVPYYEVGVGPGLDATIYSPHPDFKFKNDTPGYILVQAYVDGNNVTFEIYGTKDGRQSQIIGPTILSSMPPAPDEYTDTNTLPAGEVKQVDHAHPGATTTATYVVTKDGKEINRQVFNSYYKPWPAKFLRGTGPAAPTGG